MNLNYRSCRTSIPRKRRGKHTHTPRNEDGQARRSFIYTITSSSNTTPVCNASFLVLHDIKESRLKRKVLNCEKDITDDRAHHQNYPTVMEDVKKAVQSHIIDFPAPESH